MLDSLAIARLAWFFDDNDSSLTVYGVMKQVLTVIDKRSAIRLVPAAGQFLLWILLAVLLLMSSMPVFAAKHCSIEKLQALCAGASAGNAEISIDCNLDFSRRDCRSVGFDRNIISKRVILEGDSGSDLLLDFNDAILNAGPGSWNHQRGDILEIRSAQAQSGLWVPVRHTEIRNAVIIGSVRLYGMGRNGESEAVRQISRQTFEASQIIRKAAPYNIRLRGLTIEGQGRNPVYFGPGVHHSALLDSHISGRSERVAIYLDAESTENTVQGNIIAVKTPDASWFGFYDRGWPQIAVDGSSHNLISENIFSSLSQGGIYLYRNCGEGGTVRHATPSFNTISFNKFEYPAHSVSSAPAVYIGSRDYGALENRMPGSHCNDDESAPLILPRTLPQTPPLTKIHEQAAAKNSSKFSNADFATHNVVINNRITTHQVWQSDGQFRAAVVNDRLRLRNPQLNHSNQISGNRMAP